MIAIFGDYSYWNDGIGWSEFSERGTEQEVITQAVERWLIYRENMTQAQLDKQDQRDFYAKVFAAHVARNGQSPDVAAAYARRALEEFKEEFNL